tara:strand:- start:1478 stop:1912 length:435 start_codon:yes stop_codon:yes gene_type:complete
MNVGDAIKKAVDTGAEIYSVIGTIKSVDKSKRTCVVEPVDGSPEIFGVRYTATESDSAGFIANPADGAFVVVTFFDDNNAFVSLVTQIDTFVMNNETGDMKTILLDLIAMIEKITVPTPAGASSTPINFSELEPIKEAINGLFE